MAGYRDPIFDFKSYYDQLQSTWNQQIRTLQDKQRKNEAQAKLKITELERQNMSVGPKGYFGLILIGVIINTAIWLPFRYSFEDSAVYYLILTVGGPIIGVLFASLVNSARAKRRKADIQRVNEETEAANRELESEIQRLELALQAEYDSYRKRTAEICQSYINQFNSGDNRRPIYEWLFEVFRDAIMEADRDSYLETIVVTVIFAVHEAGVFLQRRIHKDNKFEEVEPFLFMERRMTSPVTSSDSREAMCQLSGYSVFLAQMCRNMLLNCFAKDPKAPDGTPLDAVVNIYDSNGSCHTITYRVTNAFYIPPIETAPQSIQRYQLR